MEALKQKIKELARINHSEVIAIRRHFHAHPELSKQESETAAFVSNWLKKNEIAHQTNVAGHGIVALIEGNNPESKCIALRGDMDALPIQEENDLPYKSLNTGVMHACGHDAHTASLMGAAKILNELKDEFEGSFKLFFQPSEEVYPGGAIEMINAGVLENPSPQNIIGQHVLPELVCGKVGFRRGKYMASTDEFHIKVIGKGGHGAIPNKNIDPVLIGSHIVVALQQIVSRNAFPGMPTVVSIGRFIAEGQTNVIPNSAKLSGIIRTFDEEWRKEAHEKIQTIAGGIAESMGGKVEVTIDHGYPAVYNDPEFTEQSKKWAVEYLGEENVVDLDIRMTAEDFAYFAQHRPSTFYRLGVGNVKKGIASNLHSSTFNLDEKSLETGMGLMAWLGIRAISPKN